MSQEEADGGLYAEDAGTRYKLMTLPEFRTFRELAIGTGPEWKEHYKDHVTRVESKPPGDDSTTLNVIRVRRVMAKVPPVVLYDQLQDADYRATWDDNMIEGFNIVKLDAHNDIGYYSAKFPWPLTNRDFCNMRSWMEFTNGDFVIFNHSEPHNKCPVKKKFIRAKSILTGYYIQPYEGGTGTVLTYVTHSDPCGSIPHSLLNLVMTKFAPKLLDSCEKCSEAYPAFAKKTYPPDYVYPWRTPKMDWDSTFRYPEDAVKARAKDGSGDERPSAPKTAAAAAAEAPSKAARKGTKEAADSADAAGPTSSHAQPTAAAEAPLSPAPAVAQGSAVSASPLASLAPTAPMNASDGLSIQQYRAMLQDAMNTVDRSFLREGRAPTTKDYIVRLKYVIEGVRMTAHSL